MTGDFRRVLISSFPLNGVWLLIVDSHLRLAEYGRLRIDLFSIAPAGFLFRYCRDSVSSLQPRRIHRHIHRHGINYIQGAWLVGSHSPPTGESGVQDPHSHPGSLHPPVAAEQGPDGAGANRNRKTAAFALPLIQQLSERSGKPPGRRVRALILSPTRELAAQIHENIRAYARGLHLSTAVIFGGVGYASQFRELAGGLDILVATPGRLIDYLERRTVSLDSVETLILDEADHMLDMGFAPALKKSSPKSRGNATRRCFPPPCRTISGNWPRLCFRNRKR